MLYLEVMQEATTSLELYLAALATVQVLRSCKGYIIQSDYREDSIQYRVPTSGNSKSCQQQFGRAYSSQYQLMHRAESTEILHQTISPITAYLT
ncbi:hypothetical protein RJ641_003181 [Dillenia turbinata]|uniref:Uncharacterized protein n=1 Tax=Dillenia turbinata TaxID=194707 RepID=A0AAN8VAJ6_9MAGN